ncbi:MAG: hypothetical protein V4577_25890 [Bacteroidota bacterium]
MANIFSTILGLFVGTIIFLYEALYKIGQWIYSKLLNLFKHIIPYFTKRSYKVNQPNLKAVSIRIANDIENNNYSELKGILKPEETSGRVVSGIFDTDKGQFVDEKDIHVEEYKFMDTDTQKQFGENDLLIIK